MIGGLLDLTVEITPLFRIGNGAGLAQQIDDLADDYTSFTDGLLTLKSSGIDDRVNDIDDRIERLEDRLAAYEARLNVKFAALEQLMGSIQSQSNYLSSYLTSLEKQ